MEWAWAAATSRGTSHVRSGTRCQDAFRTLAVGEDRSILVLIASDGAGSARFGGQGAVLVCRELAALVRSHFETSTTLPDEELARSWLDEIRDKLAAVAKSKGVEMRDFAATLVATIIAGDAAVILHVGDGAVIIRNGDDWTTGSWPANGEYASTTFFVTDEAGPQLRLTSLESAPEALAIFTDGIERLVLDLARQVPHAPFFERMIEPIAKLAPGRDARLSASLASYLDGDAVNARTDDDKTLILAARA